MKPQKSLNLFAVLTVAALLAVGGAPTAAGAAEPTGQDAGSCQFTGPLTLDEALRNARANNPDIRMAAARIRKAQALLEQSRAPFYPYVGLYTEYLQGDTPSGYLFKHIDQRRLAPFTDFNDPGWFENYESGIKAGINLYNGGRDRLNRDIAAAGVSVSEFEHREVSNRLVATVIRAYYDVLAARDFIQTAKASIDTVAAQLRIMNVRYHSGGALRSDILSLEVRMARAQQALVQSRNQHQTALAALASLLGIQADQPLSVVDNPEQTEHLPQTYAEGLTYALGHRPELQRLQEQLHQSRLTVAAARAGYRPRIDLQTRYYVDDDDLGYNADRDNWSAGIFVNWDLFTGFSSRADVETARAGLEEMTAANRKSLLAVEFEVKKAYLDLNEAVERWKVARSGEAKAQESLKLVKLQYEGGSATITRYLEAELDYNHARISATAAFYDREKAWADIGRVVGYWSRTDAPAAD